MTQSECQCDAQKGEGAVANDADDRKARNSQERPHQKTTTMTAELLNSLLCDFVGRELFHDWRVAPLQLPFAGVGYK